MGDHGMVCGTGGERIARHNFLQDALYDTAVAAGLAPTKEERFLLRGTDRWPADVLIPQWSGGHDTALNVTVTHPLQDLTRAGAAVTPGHALSVAFDRKVREAGEICSQQALPSSPLWLSLWKAGTILWWPRSRS